MRSMAASTTSQSNVRRAQLRPDVGAPRGQPVSDVDEPIEVQQIAERAPAIVIEILLAAPVIDAGGQQMRIGIALIETDFRHAGGSANAMIRSRVAASTARRRGSW